MTNHEITNSPAGIPPLAAVLACLIALIAAVVALDAGMVTSVLILVLTDGLCVAAVAVSAGGFGYLVVRRLAPAGSPAGLKAATACAIGLWMLSIAMLVVGSSTTGWLKGWLWWPVVGVGVVAAVTQAWPTIRGWRLPSGVRLHWLAGIILSAAAGIWLVGAAQPAGTLGQNTKDYYDVMEYHLQAPREFYDAQHIAALGHNCYSFYPSSVEMTFLLLAALSGGAYEAMYQANLMHGLWALLAVMAVVSALGRGQPARSAGAVVLLATAPGVVYLSAMAMDEMAQVGCLVLAVLWLRQWLADRSAGAAVMIGASLGVACATKYLAIGFVAGPVLLLMAATCVRNVANLKHLVIAGLLTLVLTAPWLVRNAIYTGNPVFPLATNILGRGHWSAQQEQRWLDAHGPADKPPVPVPPGWSEQLSPGRAERFYNELLANQWFGLALLVPAAAMIVIMLARKATRTAWDWCMVGLLVVQLCVWIAFTHDMPWRFLIPAVVPLAMLGGGAIDVMARWRVRSTNEQTGAKPLPIGGVLAVVACGVIGMVQLAAAGHMMEKESFRGLLPSPPGDFMATRAEPWASAAVLPAGSRILLVGDAKALYFPSGTIYATTFDDQPLANLAAEGLTGQQAVDHLAKLGLTHIWVDWPEVLRLAGTYGCQPPLGNEACLRATQGRPAGLEIIDRMQSVGLAEAKTIGWFRPAGPAGPTWPMISIYAIRNGQ